MSGHPPSGVFVHPQGICESSTVGQGTRVWAFAHVLPGARIGRDCNICDHVFVENDVVVGDRATLKSGVQLWDGVRLGDDVFVGPNATFTNDPFPRSKHRLASFLQTIVEDGASVGANATILPGLRIGRAAMVGAGAVVTKDVPADAIVIGNPATIVGYQAGRASVPARSTIIFGAGSPIIGDVEETCRRNGIAIVAIIRNFEGPVFAINKELLVDLDGMPAELLAHSMIFPLFTPGHRKFAVDQVSARGATRFDPLVDRTSIVPQSLSIGEGVYVNSGVTIGAASSLGRFSFINRGASLGHHLEVGEYASVGPAVAAGGSVRIGRGAVLGTAAVVLPGVTIGDNAVVSAAAVVARDVAANSLVAGNPARVVKTGIAGYHDMGV